MHLRAEQGGEGHAHLQEGKRSQQAFPTHALPAPPPPPSSGLLDLGWDESREPRGGRPPLGLSLPFCDGWGWGEPVRSSEAGSPPPGPRAPGLGLLAQEEHLQGAGSSWLGHGSARIIGKIPTSLGGWVGRRQGRRQEAGGRQEAGRRRVWCVGARNSQAACSGDRTQHAYPAKPEGRKQGGRGWESERECSRSSAGPGPSPAPRHRHRACALHCWSPETPPCLPWPPGALS